MVAFLEKSRMIVNEHSRSSTAHFSRKRKKRKEAREKKEGTKNAHTFFYVFLFDSFYVFVIFLHKILKNSTKNGMNKLKASGTTLTDEKSI
jgi:hypothetical protein